MTYIEWYETRFLFFVSFLTHFFLCVYAVRGYLHMHQLIVRLELAMAVQLRNKF